MSALQRHALVHLEANAWVDLSSQVKCSETRNALAHWQHQDFPLVVTRQPPGFGFKLSLGLPLPICWGRRRLQWLVAPSQVRRISSFAALGSAAIAQAIDSQQPGATESAIALGKSLAKTGLQALVYGSYGWQAVTGMPYVNQNSDLDLLVAVSNANQADCAANWMARFEAPSLRLDGELLFTNGAAAAWREWLRWRAGEVSHLMIKRRDAVTLVADLADLVNACVHPPLAA